MGEVSFRAEYYKFKDDRASHMCICNLYMFNMTTFIDTLNHTCFNSDKMSWYGWYYLYTVEEDRVYLSKGLLDMW